MATNCIDAAYLAGLEESLSSELQGIVEELEGIKKPEFDSTKGDVKGRIKANIKGKIYGFNQALSDAQEIIRRHIQK